ncbi:AsmA-like C-terminal region-containing protein [Pontibacter sp. G13]|uniref:AsmA-like C-terminal region-containing protein n=1 Tax=Pontibacter sp. G13 TaxID=3074898 RepID=UPI00288A8D9B|nr:AsmA-like C-terminal region-containing protein [Pontibacter sp. G13]WNJ18818.1 AsmA-like C-terminal region-containing protein [Pontibacter sp. G13]
MLRRLAIFAGWILAVLTGIILLAVGLFYMNRALILDRLIEIANKLQPGEVVVSGLDISPFSHFPRVSLLMQGVSYYEHPLEKQTEGEQPICQIQKLYAAFNVTDLIQGKVNVAEFSLDTAFLHLIRYPDSSINLYNAIGFDPLDTTVVDTVVPDSMKPPMEIVLEKLAINHVVIQSENLVRNEHAALRIDYLESSFRRQNLITLAHVKSALTLLGIKRGERTLVNEKPIKLAADVFLDQQTKIFTLKKAFLDIFQARLLVDGHFRAPCDGELALNFKAEKEDLGLLSLFSNGWMQAGDTLVQKGKLYLEGQINGPTKDTLPFVEIAFGGRDIALKSKGVAGELSEGRFNGYFTTGMVTGRTDGYFRLDSIHMKTTKGKLDGQVLLSNFQDPQLVVDISGAVALSAFSQLLNQKRSHFSKLGGWISCKGHLSTKLSKEKRRPKLGETRAEISLDLHDLAIASHQYKGELKIPQGKLYLYGPHLGVKDLKLETEASDLTISANVQYLLKHLLGRDTELNIQAQAESEQFQLRMLRRLDSSYQHANGVISGFALDFQATTNSRGIRQRKPIPFGTYIIKRFTGDLNTYNTLEELVGTLKVTEDLLQLQDFSVKLGQSNLRGTASWRNYAAMSVDAPQPITVSMDLRSESMRIEDLFTFHGKLLVDEAFRPGKLANFRLTGSVETSNTALRKEDFIPEGRIKIKYLRWDLVGTPLRFRDFKADIGHTFNRLDIHQLKGRIGTSDFDIIAQLKNFRKETRKDLAGSMKVTANRLNFNEWLFLQVPGSNQAEDPESGMTFDPYSRNFPSLSMEANIGQIDYGKAHIRKFRGKVEVTPDKELILTDIGTDLAGGRVSFDGRLKWLSAGKLAFSSTARARRVDLRKFKMNLEYDGKPIKISNHVQGIVAATITSKTMMSADFTIDLGQTEAEIDALILKGTLKDFGPLEAMSKYFSNKDLTTVRFDSLDNTLKLHNRKLLIPRMDINSTLGHIYLRGEQGLDMNMGYVVEVPFKLVKGVGWNMLTGRKKKDQDPDEIEYDEGGKYVAIRIVGTPSDYDVKLGKGKEVRRADKAKKKAVKQEEKDQKKAAKAQRKAERKAAKKSKH